MAKTIAWRLPASKTIFTESVVAIQASGSWADTISPSSTFILMITPACVAMRFVLSRALTRSDSATLSAISALSTACFEIAPSR